MNTYLYILLFINIIISFILVYFIQLPFKKIKNTYILFFLFIIKFFLTMYLGLSLIAFAPKIVWKYEYPFAALYHVLIPDLVCDIIFFIIAFFKKDQDYRLLKLISTGIVTVLFVGYSIWNMQTITPKYHTLTSSKLKQEYTMIFFSDLHYGSSQSKETVDQALDEIKELHPDYLLLGGDLTDENTQKEEMEYLYQKTGSLGIETYFIYGNHDRQERGEIILGARTYTDEELENAITSNGIHILYEDYTKINDDLILLGREDPSHPDKRKAVKDLPTFSYDSYIFVLDHTPYQNDEIIELKADLQFSGHSHAAQFFPMQTIYKLLNYNVYGDYYIGDTHLYVSPGIAGWYLPLRSEERCNYEVITLKPE